MQGEGVGKESCRKLHNMCTDPVDKRLDDTVTYGVILFFPVYLLFLFKIVSGSDPGVLTATVAYSAYFSCSSCYEI